MRPRRVDRLDPEKEATLRILLTCVSLACAVAILMISHAERRQEAALDALSNYRLKKSGIAMIGTASRTRDKINNSVFGSSYEAGVRQVQPFPQFASAGKRPFRTDVVSAPIV